MEAKAYTAFPHSNSADFVHRNSVFAFESDFVEDDKMFHETNTQYQHSQAHMVYDDLRRSSNDSYDDSSLFQCKTEQDAHIIQKAHALERFISQNVSQGAPNHDFGYLISRSTSPNAYTNSVGSNHMPQPYHIRHMSEPSIAQRQHVSSAPCSPTGQSMEDFYCQPLRLVPIRRPSFQLKAKKRRDSQTLPRPFACPVDNCQRRYEAWRSLQYHLKANHNIVSRRINGTIQVDPVPGTVDPLGTAKQLEKVFNDLYDVLCPPNSNGQSVHATPQSPTGSNPCHMSGIDIKINSPLSSPLSAPENTHSILSFGGRNFMQRSHSHSFGDSYETTAVDKKPNGLTSLSLNSATNSYPLRSRSYNFTSPLSSPNNNPFMDFVGMNLQQVKSKRSWDDDAYAVNSPDVPVGVGFNNDFNSYENSTVGGQDRILSLEDLYTELVTLVGGHTSHERPLSANMHQ